jgi:hypothetical protein
VRERNQQERRQGRMPEPPDLDDDEFQTARRACVATEPLPAPHADEVLIR